MAIGGGRPRPPVRGEERKEEQKKPEEQIKEYADRIRDNVRDMRKFAVLRKEENYEPPQKFDEKGNVLAEASKKLADNCASEWKELDLKNATGIPLTLNTDNFKDVLIHEAKRLFEAGRSGREEFKTREELEKWDAQVKRAADNFNGQIETAGADIKNQMRAKQVIMNTAGASPADRERATADYDALEKKAQQLQNFQKKYGEELGKFSREHLLNEMKHLDRSYDISRRTDSNKDKKLAAGAISGWRKTKTALQPRGKDDRGASLYARGSELIEDGTYTTTLNLGWKKVNLTISVEGGKVRPIPLPGANDPIGREQAYAGAIEMLVGGTGAKHVTFDVDEPKEATMNSIDSIIRAMESRPSKPEDKRVPIYLSEKAMQGLAADTKVEVNHWLFGKLYKKASQSEQTERLNNLLARLGELNSKIDSAEQKRISDAHGKIMDKVSNDISNAEHTRATDTPPPPARPNPIIASQLETVARETKRVENLNNSINDYRDLRNHRDRLNHLVLEEIKSSELKTTPPGGGVPVEKQNDERLRVIQKHLQNDMKRLDNLEKSKGKLQERLDRIHVDLATNPMDKTLNEQRQKLEKMYVNIDLETKDLQRRFENWDRDLKVAANYNDPAMTTAINAAAVAGAVRPAAGPTAEFESALWDAKEALAKVNALADNLNPAAGPPENRMENKVAAVQPAIDDAKREADAKLEARPGVAPGR